MTDAQRMAHALAENPKITREQLRVVAEVSERTARKFLEDRKKAKNERERIKRAERKERKKNGTLTPEDEEYYATRAEKAKKRRLEEKKKQAAARGETDSE